MKDAQKHGEMIHAMVEQNFADLEARMSAAFEQLNDGADALSFHDETAVTYNEWFGKTERKSRDKQPWQKGFIPKQGKPLSGKPRHVEGFKLAVEGGKVTYRRGDCHIVGSHFIGWDVFEKPWGMLKDPAPLLHFAKLDAAVVWVKLRLADRPELDEQARQRNKAHQLGLGYNYGHRGFTQLANVWLKK